MSKRIDQLSTLTNNDVLQDSRLLAIGDSATGQLYKATMAQMKFSLSPQRYQYTTAPGDAGLTAIDLIALDGVNLLAIFREGALLYEVVATPASAEYTWDGAIITFGTAMAEGERFLFIYTNAFNPF
jgi:hypothetical protein